MGRKARDMPSDFPLYAAVEGNLKLRKRYGTNGVAIERWRRELGVRYTAPAMPVKAKVIARKATRRRWQQSEIIEDLDDFNPRDCLRTMGIRFGDDW